MFGQHFYHSTIRNAVSAFGTVFNNIHVIRRDNNGNILNMQKVPLAYGPRQKFLARIEQQQNLTDKKLAIKLPRLSFEVTSMVYDSDSKLQRMSQVQLGNNQKVIGPVPYVLSFDLNIMAKTQDDMLQILEQILPYFQPDYMITIKELGNNISTDVPIILTGISLSDEYESDMLTRRVITYTLSFDMKVRFYGPIEQVSIIKSVVVNYKENGNELGARFVKLNPITVSTPADTYTIDSVFKVGIPTAFDLVVASSAGFSVNTQVVGTSSASAGFITSITGNTLHISNPDGYFVINETISDAAGNSSTVVSFTEVW